MAKTSAKRKSGTKAKATKKRPASKPKATKKSASSKRSTAKRRVSSKPKATKKRSTSKPKATKKSTSSKRPTAKKRVTSKPKATKKRSTSKPKATKKSTSSKRPTAKKRVTSKPKATKKRTTSKPKATKKSTSSKRPTAKKHVTSKPKATKKSTSSKRPTAKKRVTSKPKATKKSTSSKRPTAKKHVSPKAKWTEKNVASKRPTDRKRVSPKATEKTTEKSVVSKRPTAKEHVSPKARTTQKRTTPKRSTAKRHVSPQAGTTEKTTKNVAPKRPSPVTEKGDFDFNAWLLPTLELEQYEPSIEHEAGVDDEIKGSTRYAWIGAGQCGGRLVKSFHDLGYKKVLAVNTTHHDLDLLKIPKSQKFLMDIGGKGAGKDMARGRQAVQQYRQEILHLTRQTFGSQVDHIMICFGAGGGTGSGSATELVEVAKRYARYIGLKQPDKNVGVLMTLPTVGESISPLVAENAYNVTTELGRMAAAGKISPLIIVDNDKINKMYPGMTVRSFWPSINSTVSSLFDIFNRLSALSSRYTSFDPVDYHGIMESGGCAIMGLTKVDKFDNKFAISEAMKKNLEKTLLASGFDLTTAKLSGCVVVGGKQLMANVKGLQDNINYAFDNLSEITGRSTIHRGIYEDGRDSLRVYTVIGGLDICSTRLEELKNSAAVGVPS